MSFEERFAAMGRRIDDLVYWFANRRAPRVRVGPSIGERLTDRVHSAQDWVASQKNRVSTENIERMDPRARTAVMIVSAMVAGGGVVALGLYFMSPGGGSLTAEELRTLEKMKGASGANMFATPPPPPAGHGTGASPGVAMPRGGGLPGGGGT